MQENHRTALITGASRGLGLALARTLAQQGWFLMIDARTPGTLKEAEAELSHWTKVVAITGDISDPAHQKDLAEAANLVGGVDLVVNNAGSLGPSPQPSLMDYPISILEQVFRVNVMAPLGLVQQLRTLFKPDPVIINITSDAAIEPYAGWGGYGSSKAALEHWSSILAVENPQWHVYWVDPGDMRTQMQQDAFPDEDISDRPLPETSVPGLMLLIQGKMPNGRYQARNLVEIGRSIQ